MKRIEAVIKPQVFSEVFAALRAAALDEVLVSQVLGRGRHRDGRAYYRGIVQVIDTFPKLKVEIAVPDDRVDEIVSLICRVGRTRGRGNGKVFVADLDDMA